MTKALYRKWRPQNWDEVTGQDHVIQTLRNAVSSDRVAHAYLFAGPRGTGKTSTARLLAKAVNCLEADLSKRPCGKCDMCMSFASGRFMDLIEIDAASNTSVDDVRDLREKINFSPSMGKFKVYIIDEVHMLSTAAFNALLKTLEEPPPHAIFILATTEIHKIPATVLSRCQRHEFRRIGLADIVDYLKLKSSEENIHVPDSVLTEIARQATGSLRDAISLLDQLTSTSEDVTLAFAQKILGTATNTSVIAIIDALIEKNTQAGLSEINSTLDKGTDPEQLARQIVTYLRNVLLYKMGNNQLVEVTEDVQAKIFDHTHLISTPEILKAIEVFNQATIEEHANRHPGLGLELAFTAYVIEPGLSPKKTVTPEDSAKEPQQKPVEMSSTKPQKSQPATQKTDKTSIKNIVETKREAPILDNKGEKETKEDKKDKLEVESIPQPEQKNNTDLVEKPEPPIDLQNIEEITIKHVQNSWENIKKLVSKHNPKTVGLMNTGVLIGIQENVLILGFSTDILKNMMEKEGNINLLSDILTEEFKQSIYVKCIVTSNQGGDIPDNVKIDKDGMVSTATRDLGGKISRARKDQ